MKPTVVSCSSGSPVRPSKSCPAVEELRLAVPRQIGIVEHLVDVVLARPVEHRRDRLETEDLPGPAEVGLEDLADVHATRHAQRIEKDLQRRSIGEERHFFLGQDLGDHTLVAVPAGHLVAHRNHPLGGDVDLHHLEHARSQLIAALHAVERPLLAVDRLLDGGPHRLDDLVDVGLPLR